MQRKSRFFLAVMLVTFLRTTLGSLWLFVPNDLVNDGTLVLTVALICAVAATFLFIRRNESNIEALAQTGDLDAVKRMLIGKRASSWKKHR